VLIWASTVDMSLKFPRLKLSPHGVEDELYFNADFFLKDEEEIGMEVEEYVDRREIVTSTPISTKSTAVKEERSIAEDYEKLVFNFKNFHNENSNGQSKSFKLPSSKSPIMEALVYCSINKFGIELKEINTANQKILFLVSDFNLYYKHSCQICSKQSPSEDIRARMKALQRWFVSFPAWRELEFPFELLVRPSHYLKMHEIISKMVRFYEQTD